MSKPRLADRLPVAILVPHAALAIPWELVGRTALTSDQIFNEADAFADELATFRSKVLYFEAFPYARALLDVNRPHDLERIRPGDGIVKLRTSYGTAVYEPGQNPEPDLERRLVDTYWRPWHERLARIAADRRVRLVIDLHSMAAVGPDNYDDPGALRPKASVSNLGGGDGELVDGRFPVLSAPADLTRRFAECLAASFEPLEALAPVGPTVAINTPFFGGWDLMGHAANARQPWWMVEVNRAVYIGMQAGDSPAAAADWPRIMAVQQALWQSIETVLDIVSDEL